MAVFRLAKQIDEIEKCKLKIDLPEDKTEGDNLENK